MLHSICQQIWKIPLWLRTWKSQFSFQSQRKASQESKNKHTKKNVCSQVVLVVKNLPAIAGGIRDSDLIPRLGRSPGGENDNPLQYSCLENPMDWGNWWATVHRSQELDMTEATLHACMHAPWKKSYEKSRQHIKNHFVDKGLYNQRYGFSNSHVQMWEVDLKECWVLKNWCFQVVVPEKTLVSPLDSKEIKTSES